MSLTEGIHILSPSSPQLEKILQGIVYCHADCIINDHTVATFLPPLSYNRILRRWEKVLDSVAAGERIIIVYISKIADRVDEAKYTKPLFLADNGPAWAPLDGSLEVSGLITLHMPNAESFSFRGEIASYVVHNFHRGRGIGRILIMELEKQALKHGRWNLMLETTVGTRAEKVYEKLGWTKLGVLKDAGYKPTGDGNDFELVDEVLFWKDLRNKK